MILIRKMSVKKTIPARLDFVRTVWLCLPVVFAFSLFLFSGFAFAATSCSTPGKDGAGTPSGVINTYYPGTASVSAGATSIPVGSSSGSATQIAAGDMLLIIQMQDADINYTNSSNYGGGSGTGSGYTALNQTGVYEYAKAAGAVSGGSVSITTGLANSYRYRAASATNGQSSFQVIRVPQYSTATVSGTVSALNWNGSVGGIVAMDVDSTLTITGTITANGAGFRGGFGIMLTGATGGAMTDYFTSYSVTTNASKGEGIAGSPYYMNSPTTFNGAPAEVTGGSGYPDGTTTNASFARGAPGNAGGGGTDADPVANDQNDGGGGGGNYAAGATGGNSWNTDLPYGGIGGGAVSGLAYNRLVMGGGGGAGTTNNGTADNTTYTNPPGLACTSANGACSSGAPGGGIILLRANSITGSGTVSANGGSGWNTQNDSGGGGGAGGSIVIYTYAGGSANVAVNGGNGGNAWRSQAEGTFPGNCHGPGGGGSGGFIAYSPSTLGITMQYAAGLSGLTTTGNVSYGSGSSSGGYSTFTASNPPGPLPGADCVPKLSTSTKTVVDTTSAGAYAAGDVLQYTITLTESNGFAASGVSVTDTINTNLTNFTVVSFPTGATNSSTGTALNITGISVPASGSVTIVYNATISSSAAPGTTITNTATITNPNGIGATPTAPVVTVTGTVAGTGNKQLYLYDGTSTPTWKLSRTKPTGLTGTQTLAKTGGSYTWVENPVLASNVTINASVPVTLYLASDAIATRNVEVRLACSSATGTYLSSGNVTETTMPATATQYTFTLTAANGTATLPMTCAAGNSWQLTVINQSTGNGTRNVIVYPMSGTNNSYVNLPSQNVISVGSIGFYSAPYPSAATVTSVPPGGKVYIRATISDPFGSYDITGATIKITDPSGTVQLLPTGMGTPVYDSGAASKIYEYSSSGPFSVPSGAALGNWSVSVTATEGSEGTITNTGYFSMIVGVPNVFILKSANKSSANPGDIITYTVQVKNTGVGTANTVTLTDAIGYYMAVPVTSSFSFTDGSPASGLTLGTPSYSKDSGSTWTYTPVSGGGGAPANYDGLVTNWKIIMNGTMNGNGGNFTINYNFKVK
jgi:uncharacterized repeat protein (TIGR01451 family)/fimbrial isopeptide formation D2 family protein